MERTSEKAKSTISWLKNRYLFWDTDEDVEEADISDGDARGIGEDFGGVRV